MIELRKIVSVVVECEGRRYRVIDSLRALVGDQHNRNVSEAMIGRKVLDLARKLEVGTEGETPEGPETMTQPAPQTKETE